MKRYLAISAAILFFLVPILVYRSGFWLKSVTVGENNGRLYIEYETIWTVYQSSLQTVSSSNTEFDGVVDYDLKPISSERLPKYGIPVGTTREFRSAFGLVQISNHGPNYSLHGYYDEPKSIRVFF
ncbi:MAG: hypothetical protein JNM28_08370 [Armatimonadetes bacterium]|nr:hypothetical protein [Armatimonadota bacterium]